MRMQQYYWDVVCHAESCLPLVPLKGTVGASGDLAPLSHLALGMMGEGLMWSPTSGWSQAGDVLHAHHLKELKLAPKEVRWSQDTFNNEQNWH